MRWDYQDGWKNNSTKVVDVHPHTFCGTLHTSRNQMISRCHAALLHLCILYCRAKSRLPTLCIMCVRQCGTCRSFLIYIMSIIRYSSNPLEVYVLYAIVSSRVLRNEFWDLSHEQWSSTSPWWMYPPTLAPAFGSARKEVHVWIGHRLAVTWRWVNRCDHPEGKPHQFWLLWCVASLCTWARWELLGRGTRTQCYNAADLWWPHNTIHCRLCQYR